MLPAAICHCTKGQYLVLYVSTPDKKPNGQYSASVTTYTFKSTGGNTMNSEQPIVSISNLVKAYGNVRAVDGISFTAGKGEVLALLGPNGAGKTTTLECLEGLKTPGSGSISICGLDPAKHPGRLLSKIGVQLQSSGLPESIQAGEAMKIFCAYRGIRPRLDLLERFGLQQKLAAQYQELSTGLKRRLSLALAIAHDPEVLFLDEPTAGLDVSSRVELHTIIRSLMKTGTTIILATHDMAEAEALSSRIVILLNGRIADSGTPMQITARGNGLTKISVKTVDSSLENMDGKLPGVQVVSPGDDYLVYYSNDIGSTLGAIIRKIESSGDKLVDLRVQRPSLEERFLEITG